VNFFLRDGFEEVEGGGEGGWAYLSLGADQLCRVPFLVLGQQGRQGCTLALLGVLQGRHDLLHGLVLIRHAVQYGLQNRKQGIGIRPSGGEDPAPASIYRAPLQTGATPRPSTLTQKRKFICSPQS
jgi:hypothetical protein